MAREGPSESETCSSTAISIPAADKSKCWDEAAASSSLQRAGACHRERSLMCFSGKVDLAAHLAEGASPLNFKPSGNGERSGVSGR